MSGAILSIDLGSIGNSTYDLPTLDDDTRPGSADANDPFGGNDGRNQARIVPGGPVQVYSPGFRNPYDLIITGGGRMYTADNGHNAGQGDMPAGEGPAGACTNGAREPGVTGPDSIHLVSGRGYYGGHPNPTRGNQANTFAGGQSPVPAANPVECDYRARGTENGAIATDPSSTNGLTEYTASNFGGALAGDILLASYDNYVTRLHLSADGRSVLSKTRLFSSVGVHPLDVTAASATDPFPGTVWVTDVAGDDIYVFEPNDYDGGVPACTAADDPAADDDGDGYDNADEIDNGTDPCSAADTPADWDTDGTSNLNDTDDDNDGRSDKNDPFAIDPDDGRSTSLPVSYTFDAATPDAGGLLDLGFTGLMTNGSADYESLYDPTQLTAGGAPGVLTVDTVTDGDAKGPTNTQEYGFQFGVRVDAGAGPFTAHTRIVSPFAGTQAVGQNSMGLTIGTGGQDDYVKLVTTAGAGKPGVTGLREVAGAVTQLPKAAVPLPGPSAVDLFLTVDPAAATVQAAFSVTKGGTPGPRTNLGQPVAVPRPWLDGSAGLAVGVISTSIGPGDPFPATWDLIEVTRSGGDLPPRPDATVKLAADATALGNNVYNATGVGQTRAVTAARGTTRTFVVRVRNNGPATDSFIVSGPGGDATFSVRYYRGPSGTTDVTAAVVAGSYRMTGVAPGASRVLRQLVTVARSASRGAQRGWLLRFASVADASGQDVVGSQVRVG